MDTQMTELAERMGAILADVVAAAILEGADPHERIGQFLAEFATRWPGIAGITARWINASRPTVDGWAQ